MDSVNAKIRAMKARLLTIEQYRALAQSPSAEHFRSQIKSEPLTSELKRVSNFLADVQNRKLLALVNEKDLLSCWKYIKTMPKGQNRSALTITIGTEIDIFNMQCINRLKKYYPKEEIYPHLISAFYKVDKNTIKQLIEGAEYPHIHANYSYKTLKKAYIKAAKNYPHSAISAIMCYFFFKKLEMRNLTAILEGIKNTLPPEEILSHIIL